MPFADELIGAHTVRALVTRCVGAARLHAVELQINGVRYGRTDFVLLAGS